MTNVLMRLIRLLGLALPGQDRRLIELALRLAESHRSITNSEQKWLNQFEIVNALTKKTGLSLYAAHPFWQQDEEYASVTQILHKGGIKMRVRKYVVYLMAKAVSDLRTMSGGDTVECGCYKGEGSFLICLGTGQRDGCFHHVFDSFEGLSHPTEADMNRRSGATEWQARDLAVPLGEVQSRLAQFDWIRWHPGWIPSQFHNVLDRRFSFVHIDVDLYEPTRDSLEFFYPRTIPGGYIMCDDYAFLGCPGARRAFDDFIRDKPEKSVVYLGTGQGFIVKR